MMQDLDFGCVGCGSANAWAQRRLIYFYKGSTYCYDCLRFEKGHKTYEQTSKQTSEDEVKTVCDAVNARTLEEAHGGAWQRISETTIKEILTELSIMDKLKE